MSLDPEIARRIRRDPRQFRASYNWNLLYDAYQQIMKSDPTEAQKFRWRRMGKLEALRDVEALARKKNFDGVFAWSTEDVGMERTGQQLLI